MKWPKVSGNHDLENGRPGKLGKQTPRETNSEQSHNVHTHNASGGAQIIQTGFSERWLIILLIMVSFVALIFAGIALHESSQATALAITVRTNNAKIEVLQYDHNALKAQLVAKGLYQATEH